MSEHKTKAISRTYRRRYGGWGLGDDEPWYEEEEFTLYEGDECPDCGEGKLKVSQRGKLYCSALCWLDEEQGDE